MTKYKISERFVMPDLSNVVPTAFIVDGLLAKSSLYVLVAAPGVGKTAFCLNMAKHITEGKEFLGMPIVNKVKSAFIQFDMSPDQHVEYNSVFAPDCPIPFIPGSVLDVVDDKPIIIKLDLASDDGVADVIHFCKTNDIKLVFVDTLAAAFPEIEENSNNGMTKALAYLKLMNHHGITVVLLHHVAKTERGFGTMARGASSIIGSADGVIELQELRDGRVLVKVTKTRTKHKKGVRGAYRLVESGIESCDAKEAIKDAPETIESRVLNVFKTKNTSVLMRKDLDATIKVSPNDLQLTLEHLVETGVLKLKKVQRGAHQYTLTESESEDV